MIQTIPSRWTSAAAEFDSSYHLPSDVLLLVGEDETGRLLDLGGRCFAFSAVGTVMLQQTLQSGPAAAVRAITGRYGVAEQQARADLDVFLKDLQRRRLLLGPGQRRRRSHSKLSVLLLGPALFCIHRAIWPLKARAWALLALARIAIRLFGWSRTIAAWQRCQPRGREALSSPQFGPTVQAVDEAVRAVAAEHLLPMACKERALACWSLLRAAGAPAELVVGVDFFPFAGHCWCVCGPWTLSDYVDRCAKYTPVIRYA
jgi:hypothetical protein